MSRADKARKREGRGISKSELRKLLDRVSDEQLAKLSEPRRELISLLKKL